MIYRNQGKRDYYDDTISAAKKKISNEELEVSIIGVASSVLLAFLFGGITVAFKMPLEGYLMFGIGSFVSALGLYKWHCMYRVVKETFKD